MKTSSRKTKKSKSSTTNASPSASYHIKQDVEIIYFTGILAITHYSVMFYGNNVAGDYYEAMMDYQSFFKMLQEIDLKTMASKEFLDAILTLCKNQLDDTTKAHVSRHAGFVYASPVGHG